MKAFIVCAVIAAVCLQGYALPLDVAVETLHSEITEVKATGVKAKISFVQAGGAQPPIIADFKVFESSWSTIDSQKEDFDTNGFLPSSCSLDKVTPVQKSDTKILSGLTITCNATGSPVRSVTLHEKGKQASGTCFSVPAASWPMLSVKYKVEGKLVPEVAADVTAAAAEIDPITKKITKKAVLAATKYPAYIMYTATPVSSSASVVEQVLTIKPQFFSSVPPAIDPSKAGAFFTGYGTATVPGIVDTLKTSYNGLLTTPLNYVMSVTLADMPCAGAAASTRPALLFTPTGTTTVSKDVGGFAWNGLSALSAIGVGYNA